MLERAAAGETRALLAALAHGSHNQGDTALRASARQFLLCRTLAERVGGTGADAEGAGAEPTALLVACRQAAGELAGGGAGCSLHAGIASHLLAICPL